MERLSSYGSPHSSKAIEGWPAHLGIQVSISRKLQINLRTYCPRLHLAVSCTRHFLLLYSLADTQ